MQHVHRDGIHHHAFHRSRWQVRCAIALTVLTAAACKESPVGPQPTGDIVRGQRLMAQYQCGACHAIPGVPIARGIDGPPLDLYGRRSYIAGHIPNRPELLAQWIADPRSLVPGTAMPNMGVAPQDARDMAAYLQSLR